MNCNVEYDHVMLINTMKLDGLSANTTQKYTHIIDKKAKEIINKCLPNISLVANNNRETIK